MKGVKIKESEDLNNLAKLGFIEDEYSWEYKKSKFRVIVLKASRKIYLQMEEDFSSVPSIMLDLIQEGLVEKI